MLLFWRIRYLDRVSREFHNRDLFLLTETLELSQRAAVEACHRLRDVTRNRDFLKFRSLFTQPLQSQSQLNELIQKAGGLETVFMYDYFEDERGKILSSNEIAEIISGNKGAKMLPRGGKAHDVAYVAANASPVDIGGVSLTAEQLNVLAYFVRDLRELTNSSFYKEGPGVLSFSAPTSDAVPPIPKTIRTSVSDEEIRSFVMIFRRLYMKTEPANLKTTMEIMAAAIGSHPFADWIGAESAEVMSSLAAPPSFFSMTAGNAVTFTVKRLIDVFLYTQYAHQPSRTRLAQFEECLKSVQNDRAQLTFLFLTEMWSLSLRMHNLGQHARVLLEAYCDYHKQAPPVVLSPGEIHPGIGTMEKRDEQKKRIMRESAAGLAKSMCIQAGVSEEAWERFIDEAIATLESTLER